jgi:hypothetical protein
MTPEIADLRKRLAAINDHAARVPPAIENGSMAAELAKLKAYLNRSASGPGVSRDRINEAVSAFQRSGELASPKEGRRVCWGINASGIPGEPILIEDPKRFPRLLDHVHRFRDDLPPYRRCWRGLLGGYFAYDPKRQAAGAANWGLLRDYLWNNRAVTSGEGFRPDWMITMAEHANLLTADPCAPYGKSLFDGDNSIETKLRKDLLIDENSWLARRFPATTTSSKISCPSCWTSSAR